MKSLFVAVITLAVSMGASAKVSNVLFKAVDQSAETQLCLAAAQNGVEGAKAMAESLGLDYLEAKRSTICNDTSLHRFAHQYTKTVEPVLNTRVTYKFVAADQAPASKICTEALVNGLKATQKQYKDISNVYCNGELINRFVRKNKA